MRAHVAFDPPMGPIVAADKGKFLAINGGEYYYNYVLGLGWVRDAQWELPISVDQVAYWECHIMGDGPYHLVSKNGEVWQWIDGTWFNRGQPPVGPVSTEQKSWGDLKGQYKNND